MTHVASRERGRLRLPLHFRSAGPMAARLMQVLWALALDAGLLAISVPLLHEKAKAACRSSRTSWLCSRAARLAPGMLSAERAVSIPAFQALPGRCRFARWPPVSCTPAAARACLSLLFVLAGLLVKLPICEDRPSSADERAAALAGWSWSCPSPGEQAEAAHRRLSARPTSNAPGVGSPRCPLARVSPPSHSR